MNTLETLLDLRSISTSDEPYISAERIDDLCLRAVWFCSDKKDQYYMVFQTDERSFGFACFASTLRRSKYEVMIATPHCAEVDAFYKPDHPQFEKRFVQARARAIAHAVAQSMTDGFWLQDAPEVGIGFIQSFADWLR